MFPSWISSSWRACLAGSYPERPNICGSILTPVAGVCSTTNKAAGNPAGNNLLSAMSVSTPPAEAPTTTILWSAVPPPNLAHLTLIAENRMEQPIILIHRLRTLVI